MTVELACDGCGHIPAREDCELDLSLTDGGKWLCEDCYQAEIADEGIVTAHEFAAVQEPGASPVVGAPGEVLMPEGGDVILYGNGGASKTTLTLDLACHLAAGDDWLGFPIPGPTQVLVVEAEGPRPMFRQKLRSKLEGWSGSAIDNRLHVMETPWAEFQMATARGIARWIERRKIDVLIVGPVTAVGFEERGTIQEVRGFMAQVDGFRQRTGRPLATVLVHHENKGGTISGAFEGVSDTLLHAEVHSRGKTLLEIEKARWASRWHKTTLKLAWTDGESFEVVEEGERSLVDEIAEHLAANPWHTKKEIARPVEAGGIGANVDTVGGILESNRDLFESRTGDAAKEVGRHPSATVWNVIEVTQGSESPESPAPRLGGDYRGDSGDSGCIGVTQSRVTPQMPADVTPDPSHPESANGGSAR